MVAVTHYDTKGQKAGTVDLPQELFWAEPNTHLLYLSVRQYLDNQRQGTANTKNAADVRGGGKKPFNQKHTGRARQGSNRSSIMVGGYVAHGPHPRDYSWAMPRQQRRGALISALSDCCHSGKMAVIDALETTGKTKELHGLLRTMELTGKKVLLLDAKPARAVLLSVRNIPGLFVKPAREVNPYDLLWSDQVVVTAGGLESLKEVLMK